MNVWENGLSRPLYAQIFHLWQVYLYPWTLDSQGSYMHRKTAEKITENLWRGNSSGHGYDEKLFSLLNGHGYMPTDAQQLRFGRSHRRQRIFTEIPVNDHLVFSSDKTLIEAFLAAQHLSMLSSSLENRRKYSIYQYRTPNMGPYTSRNNQ